MSRSAYIHIPFCRRRCYYCDFAVSVVGDRPPMAQQSASVDRQSFGTIAHYIKVLCEEIRITEPVGGSLETVFFGGGTPSLLAVEQLIQILTALDQQFGIAADAEISMEIDPGTFDLAQVQGYRAAGVNRVSVGVQAFQPELLQACGRSHTVADVYAAVEWVQQAGLTNFSLDLISGLPHQTLAHWQESLEMAIALAPTHLSCYDLTIEPMTAFSRQYKPGVQPLPSDDTTAAMYRTAQHVLTAAGYNHYEISNYARPGYQCRHNRVYWENRPFYGFGMGATSYLAHDRLSRPRKTREYYAWVDAQQQEYGESKISSQRSNVSAPEKGSAPIKPNSNLKLTPEEPLRAQTAQLEPLSSPLPTASLNTDRLLDTLMLGLRLAEGLSLATLIEQFGQTTWARVWECLQPFQAKGWLVITSDRNAAIDPSSAPLPKSGRLQLTDPEGFLFSNVILVSLFEAFE